MARHVGGARVEGGWWLRPRTWEVQVVGEGGGVLPGDAAATWLKVPFLVLAVLVPLLGAVFLVATPLIGFALVGWELAKRAFGAAKGAASDLAATA